MPTSWIELDTEALRHNAERVRALVAPARLMPVVKANAYGAGAVPMATALAAAGVDAFAVALVREALELRRAGITATLVQLTYFGRDDVEDIVTHAIEPVVFTAETAAWLSEAARARGRRARVWLKVDTGLGRIGVPFTEAPAFARTLLTLPGLEIAGLLSTLAENPDRTLLQVSRMRAVRDEVAELRGRPATIASTDGILAAPDSHLEIVRPGILLLGVVPRAERVPAALLARLAPRPVVTWKARVAYLKRVPAGEQVGYGVRPALGRETPVATLAVGWADGYAQTLAGVGHVLLQGRRCPVLAISANSTLVDATGVHALAVGDEAVLLGRQGADAIATDDIARTIGSHYRVLAAIPATIPRRLV